MPNGNNAKKSEQDRPAEITHSNGFPGHDSSFEEPRSSCCLRLSIFVHLSKLSMVMPRPFYSRNRTLG